MSIENKIIIINKLIEKKKEGVYWDFKQEHHHSNIDFIHDIICLANAKYDGDRYLIFGVSDDGNIIGIENSKKQSDIICLLRDAKFADNVFPDIFLDTLEIQEKKIDVLTIKNTFNKPFYLIEDKKALIRAGTIYTRNMDTNTPKNRVASSKDIEYMWKERFGLHQNVFERFKTYLEDYQNWEASDNVSFYKFFPEFTIRKIDSDLYQGNETAEWTRGEIGYFQSGNYTYAIGLFFYSTLIKEILCVVFDGGKKTVVNPTWEPINEGRIYCYYEDSLEYAYHKFLVKEIGRDYSLELRYSFKAFRKLKTSFSHKFYFSIPIFKNKNDYENFLQFLQKNSSLQIESGEAITDKYEEKQNELFYQLIKYYNCFKVRSISISDSCP